MKVIRKEGSHPIKAWLGTKTKPLEVFNDSTGMLVINTPREVLDIEDFSGHFRQGRIGYLIKTGDNIVFEPI